jgi:hypothetical protein
MADDLTKITRSILLPSEITNETVGSGVTAIDRLLDASEHQGNGFLANVDYLRQARDAAARYMQGGYQLAKVSVLVPVGLFGLAHGLSFPDLDIPLLGIGYHRFFLFHSALGLVALRYFYRQWVEKQAYPDQWTSRVKRKLGGALLGSFAVGVGVHLAIDVFQPKAVIFPFIGSLVDGTLVDDNVWLIGNSLWAFRIAHDVFVLSLADEFRDAKEFVEKQFQAQPEDWAPLRQGVI